MHVLVIPSWYPSRVQPVAGIFFKEQSIAIANAGYKVGVIAPFPQSLKNLKLQLYNRKGESTENGIITIWREFWSYPKCKTINRKQWQRIGYNLFEEYIEKYGKPDIIQAHSMILGGVLALEIKLKYHIPFVVTEHSSSFISGEITEKEKRLFKKVVSESSSLIVISESLVKALDNLFDIECVYIPNAVDVDYFSPDDDYANLKKNSFVFFALCNLVKLKGLNFLLEAFEMAFKDKKFELWIGGEGIEKNNLYNQVKKSGIESRVKFLGALNRTEVLKYLRLCDVFVLPSLLETFGIVLIEALAVGKPVVSTKCGGPESIINQNNGILVPPGSSQELSEALKNISENYQNYDKKKIRRDCIERFSNHVVIEKIAAEFHSICDQNLFKNYCEGMRVST